MFSNQFGKNTSKEFEQAAQDNYPVPELPKKNTEVYRVGVTENGDTTLTLLSPNGLSTTLIMSQDRCEQLIRMLRATYPEEGSNNEPTS